MLDAESYQAKVELHCQNSPSASQLRSSRSISINSARKIAGLHIDLIYKQSQSEIFTMTEVMLAIIILGFHIMKYSVERRTRADLELLSALSHYAESQYSEAGQHPNFVEGTSSSFARIHEVC
jgi:hypothetical protein